MRGIISYDKNSILLSKRQLFFSFGNTLSFVLTEARHFVQQTSWILISFDPAYF